MTKFISCTKKWLNHRYALSFHPAYLMNQSPPSVQLFNEYFGGGMAGLVFQELREARALAYSAWARFFTPSRPGEENVLVGSIGCQADKTLDAVHAFVKLLKEMPISEPRWKSAYTSILSNYRTSPIASLFHSWVCLQCRCSAYKWTHAKNASQNLNSRTFKILQIFILLKISLDLFFFRSSEIQRKSI